LQHAALNRPLRRRVGTASGLPAADIDVDDALVARLIEAQHPDLAGPLTLVANGWDNVLYRLGENWCVRLPRRRVAVQLILNERRWLPSLAERLGVDIPVPVRAGEPSDQYPWPWSIAPWFGGALAAAVPPASRSPLVAGLAEFVARMHSPAPRDAPHNPVRGVPLESRSATVLARLDGGTIPRGDELRALWSRLMRTPVWSGPPLWLHGDLHPANLLVGTTGHLRAVLDFGDLTAGDPATDLAVAWLAFEPDARAVFRERVTESTGTGADTWLRARAWALSFGTAFVAHSEEASAMRAIGDHALQQVLLDE
jgi:aminoglycoside phosphotransferase (APT) family kinase protein